MRYCIYERREGCPPKKKYSEHTNKRGPGNTKKKKKIVVLKILIAGKIFLRLSPLVTAKGQRDRKQERK